MSELGAEKNGAISCSSSSTICVECKKDESKYKCPGCSIRTCSLLCVKSHKQRTSCSGKRNVTQFVPLSQFDDKTLLSDYNMLEEVKRVADSAQRLRHKMRVSPEDFSELRSQLKCLTMAAASRKTRLLYLPRGMYKRENNQSRFNDRKKFISWTIEWRFHSTDIVLVDHGVHEDSNICSVIEKHLQPGPWKNKLWNFSQEKLECLKFFIRKYPKGPKSPFKELDVNVPIKKLLARVTILEYPIIHVFLPSHSCNFKIVKDPVPVPRRIELEDSVMDEPKGVTFKEEEIEEDGGSPNPQNSSPKCQTPNQSSLNKPVDTANGVTSNGATEDSLNRDPDHKETGLFDDLDFEFDQGLIDEYADLMAQVNPDEFLDFEGEFVEETEVDQKRYLSHSRRVPVPNVEIEEGEIAE